MNIISKKYLIFILLLCYNPVLVSGDAFGNELNDNQKKILQGAKQCLEEKFSYDKSMAYHILTYKDKINTGKKVFPGGDLSPEIGVCTDVTVRALRYGLQLDLQKEINEDATNDWKSYPMKRWSAKKPDSNIDHRRVPNQEVWFKKYWKDVTADEYMPGDVIIWDMNGDGWTDHIGIISDNKQNNNYKVIHNFPDPGYVAEEDVIYEWKIAGVYRVN